MSDVLPESTIRMMEEYKRLRGRLLWLLYNHQGGSSKVGSAAREALGIKEYAELTPAQVKEARESAKQAGFIDR